ncbi:MAG: RNA polymerase sigma factor SigZ [Roseibium sp.]|uniref:RNA polymerase sigma factor SigZ n=1 Tax=Roseibium sp. TaxID=1936156 RepID=UPI00260AEB9D|nr:RNA polymerase sigma factor SigZ [Roseibium sp.]MCV0425944.1 RNA polymerase sigma factor SigZ [Roseibium sp.]
MQADLESIWADYRSSLGAFLSAKISNPADVDELLQEILLKTHRNIGTLGKGESLKAWLFQIANNTAIDFYRKKGKARTLKPEDLWYFDSGENKPHDLDRCIGPFIDALPEETGALLRKVELEGVSQKKYAEDQGISYSTLKSRVQKARTQLREVFENCCHFTLDTQGNIVDYRQKTGKCGKC